MERQEELENDNDRKCIPLQIILLNSSTMKTRLLILAMVFMPIIAGCSKDKSYEKLIVGNWFLGSLESSSVDRPEESVKIEFTAETAEAFMSFTADGEFSTVSKMAIILMKQRLSAPITYQMESLL